MTRTLLIRGMLSGAAAGVLVFLLARLVGEPTVDAAIGVEDQMARAMGGMADMALVPRDVQASWGLFVGVMVYAVALGGLFSLLFAFAWGRIGRLTARATAALLAAGGFVAVYLVPFLKYPANPPSVGEPSTIQFRTAIYFGMMVIAIAGMAAAVNLGRALKPRLGAWNAALAGGLTYLLLVAVAWLWLPPLDEVPPTFPASLLWSFRTTAVGLQLVLWTTMGLVFGELAERAWRAARVSQSATTPGSF
jgi:putative cobalt transporter subunit CbtA